MLSPEQEKLFHEEYRKEKELLKLKYKHFQEPDELDKLVEFYFFMIVDSDEFEFHQQCIIEQTKYGYYDHPRTEGYLTAIESFLYDSNSNKYTRQRLWGSASMKKAHLIKSKMFIWEIKWSVENIEGYDENCLSDISKNMLEMMKEK